ncbi:MAG: hypothetical protein COW12_04350 [Candidatus Omnitrophica bacterium CG12_big_fil_rev_8_21_14_0_65_45_16]|nr:MAG: hypothetical protein COW12_04350 [Candidatus Omnitrophica bacterium CG12_big_fil_rev_8_21_14_0_65_45_16]
MLEAKTSVRVQTVSENIFSRIEGAPTLVQARLELSYDGELSGQGSLEELKIVFSPKRAAMQGLMRFSGTLGLMEGSFVLIHTAKFINGRTTVVQRVAPGSGTGGFKGIRGKILAEGLSLTDLKAFFRYFFA